LVELVRLRGFVVAAECWSRVAGVQMGGEHTTEFIGSRSEEPLPMKARPNTRASLDAAIAFGLHFRGSGAAPLTSKRSTR
jgi:hypothetical protein